MEKCRAALSVLLGLAKAAKQACTGLLFGGRDIFSSHFLPGLQRAHDGGRGAHADDSYEAR